MGGLHAVTKVTSLRILLAIAAAEDLEIYEMDIITAFLLGNLQDTKLHVPLSLDRPYRIRRTFIKKYKALTYDSGQVNILFRIFRSYGSS